jgi:hypothetical protein
MLDPFIRHVRCPRILIDNTKCASLSHIIVIASMIHEDRFRERVCNSALPWKHKSEDVRVRSVGEKWVKSYRSTFRCYLAKFVQP